MQNVPKIWAESNFFRFCSYSAKTPYFLRLPQSFNRP